MKSPIYFIAICLMASGSLFGRQELPITDLISDSQALAYCKHTENTYVVIVWPKGINHLGYIAEKLNDYASIKYIKKFVINKQHMFSLYRQLHKSMSYESSKKYFKPYIKASSHEPLHLAALLIETKAPIEEIWLWKKEMRDHIGEDWYSLHINDRYYPETIEAAHAVFNGIRNSL